MVAVTLLPTTIAVSNSTVFSERTWAPGSGEG
jgi:hypothetical protein